MKASHRETTPPPPRPHLRLFEPGKTGAEYTPGHTRPAPLDSVRIWANGHPYWMDLWGPDVEESPRDGADRINLGPAGLGWFAFRSAREIAAPAF